jgi:hypothetical protein
VTESLMFRGFERFGEDCSEECNRCEFECSSAQHDSVHRYVWLGDIWQDRDLERRLTIAEERNRTNC